MNRVSHAKDDRDIPLEDIYGKRYEHATTEEVELDDRKPPSKRTRNQAVQIRFHIIPVLNPTMHKVMVSQTRIV